MNPKIALYVLSWVNFGVKEQGVTINDIKQQRLKIASRFVEVAIGRDNRLESALLDRKVSFKECASFYLVFADVLIKVNELMDVES